MNPIKEWFHKLKSEKTFKKAGPAHSLSEASSSKSKDTGSTKSQPSKALPKQSNETLRAKQAAAAAAEVRIQQSQASTNWSSQAIKNQAKKEIELEKSQNQTVVPKPKEVTSVKADIPNLAVSGVFFTCPIIGPDVLPRDELEEKIKEFLYEQLEQERGLTACLIIHTLNKNKVQVQKGVETISRYLTNIINEPGEEKYRRIRVKNRAFQEKVADLEGAFDFLYAAGFEKRMLPSEDGEEEYLVFPEENLDIERIQMLKEALLSAEPIKPVLDRNIKVLKPAQVSERVSLPDDFYNLTLEEIKKEQESRAETVELLSTLRTREMRERDEIKERHIYKFTLIRIRFPHGIILQGTFSVHERISAVRKFVAENLADPNRDFDLLLPGGNKITDDSQTLLEAKLVPAVILTFASSNDGSSHIGFLSPECMFLLSDL